MKKIFYSILLSGMMVLSACDALDLSPWESSEVRF